VGHNFFELICAGSRKTSGFLLSSYYFLGTRKEGEPHNSFASRENCQTGQSSQIADKSSAYSAEVYLKQSHLGTGKAGKSASVVALDIVAESIITRQDTTSEYEIPSLSGQSFLIPQHL